MQKLNLFSFIIVASLFMLTGCSIQKRVYFPGYDVKWNTRHSASTQKIADDYIAKNNKKDSIYLKGKTDNETALADNTISASANPNEIILAEKRIQVDSSNNTIKSYKRKNVKAKPQSLFKTKKGKSSDDDTTKVNPYSLIGFILGIAVLISSFILLLFFIWPFFSLFFIFSGIAYLIALTFDIIGLVQIRKHPEKWSDRFSTKGIILDIIFWIATMLLTGLCALIYFLP